MPLLLILTILSILNVGMLAADDALGRQLQDAELLRK